MMKRSVILAGAVTGASAVSFGRYFEPVLTYYQDKNCKVANLKDGVNNPEGAKYVHVTHQTRIFKDGGTKTSNVLGTESCLPHEVFKPTTCASELTEKNWEVEDKVFVTKTFSTKVITADDPRSLYDPVSFYRRSNEELMKQKEKTHRGDSNFVQFNKDQQKVADEIDKKSSIMMDISNCLEKKICDGQKANPCAPFFTSYFSGYNSIESDFDDIAKNCYETTSSNWADGDIVKGPCKEGQPLSDSLFAKYKGELKARKGFMDHTANLFMRCVNLPIVCDGENAALKSLLAEKKTLDEAEEKRVKEFDAFQAQRQIDLQEEEKQSCISTCAKKSKTDCKRAENQHDEQGKENPQCEHKCEHALGRPDLCKYDTNKPFEGMIPEFQLKEESQGDPYCCQYAADYDPKLFDPKIDCKVKTRATRGLDNHFSFGWGSRVPLGGLGYGYLLQFDCVEQVDPNKVDFHDPVNAMEREEAAAEAAAAEAKKKFDAEFEEAWANEQKNLITESEAKNLKESDYGRTWTCKTVAHPKGYPAGVSHEYLGKSMKTSVDYCEGTALQICWEAGMVEEDNDCFAPVKMVEDIYYTAAEAALLTDENQEKTWSCKWNGWPNAHLAQKKTVADALAWCKSEPHHICWDASFDGTDNKCVYPKKLGSALPSDPNGKDCKDGSKCASQYCDAGTKTCMDRPPPAAAVCACPSGNNLLRMSGEDGSSSEACATTFAAAGVGLVALLA